MNDDELKRIEAFIQRRKERRERARYTRIGNEWMSIRMNYTRRPLWQRLTIGLAGASLMGVSLWATSEPIRPAVLLTYLVLVAIFLIASAE